MRKIGYCRVSQHSPEPRSPDRRSSRRSAVDVIFREKVSGKSIKNRPELEKAIDELGTGDIWSSPNGTAPPDDVRWHPPDRAHQCPRRADQGARQAAPGSDHADRPRLYRLPIGMAEDERRRILKRANDGRAAAMAKGTRFGRKPKLTDISRPKPSSVWLRAKAADQSPRRWPCTTPPWRGWRLKRQSAQATRSPIASRCC